MYNVKYCPLCRGTMNVINTRTDNVNGTRNRIRKCSKCNHAVETAEIPANLVSDIDELKQIVRCLEKENLKLKTKLTRVRQFYEKEFPKEEANE